MSIERLSKTIIHHSVAEADGEGVVAKVQGYTNGVVQVSGTFTATVTFEGSQDGENWVALDLVDLTSDARVTTATAGGMFLADIPGLRRFRAVISDYSDGEVSVRSVWIA